MLVKDTPACTSMQIMHSTGHADHSTFRTITGKMQHVRKSHRFGCLLLPNEIACGLNN